jgi:hypothetical protein
LLPVTAFERTSRHQYQYSIVTGKSLLHQTLITISQNVNLMKIGSGCMRKNQPDLFIFK